MFNKIVLNKYMNIIQNVSSEADLFISGDIEDMEWWDEDITPGKIMDSLSSLEGITTLNLVINSMGGSVTAGNFIIDLLDEYRRKNGIKIHSKVSNAFSMASGIAMVGDTVSIHANGIFMVHKPLSSTWGNADDMRKQAEVLDVFESSLVRNYMRHFKGTVDGASDEEKEVELRALLENETWLTANQALEYGFVQSIIEPMDAVASADSQKFLAKIKNKKERKGESEMKYDNSLKEKYGISEETFNSFENVSDLLTIINASHASGIETAINEAKADFEKKYENSVIIDCDKVKDYFEAEEKVTEEMVINKMTEEKADPEVANKLKEYDNLVSERNEMRKSFVDATIQSGIRAMGVESFNKETWESALENMSYSLLKNVKSDWDKLAKDSLNAGSSTSQREEGYTGEKEIVVPNKENYNI